MRVYVKEVPGVLREEERQWAGQGMSHEWPPLVQGKTHVNGTC